jgi:hypothetical protein
MLSKGATWATPTSLARWAIWVTLPSEERPARALSSVAGSSPRVRAKAGSVGARLPGHGAVITQPGGRAPAAVGQRSVGAIKAVEATEELCFEPIGSAPDADDVCTLRVRREGIDALVDECVHSVLQTRDRIRDREGFHAQIIPNICSVEA